MKAAADKLVWVLVALLGAGALGIVALSRGEHVNAMWLVIAAVLLPPAIFPGHQAMVQTRIPPSSVLPFPPRNGVLSAP